MQPQILRIFLGLALAVLCGTFQPIAAEDIALKVEAIAESMKREEVEKLSDSVDAIEKKISQAQKKREVPLVKELKKTLAETKKTLAETKKRPLDVYREKAAAEVEKGQREAKIIAELEETGPVVVIEAGIGLNIIGNPEINVACRNNAMQNVEAFEVTVECFTKFDEPVQSISGSSIFVGIMQKTTEPHKFCNASWQLAVHRTTAKANVWVNRVRLANGDEWVQTREEAASKRLGIRKAVLAR